MIALCGDQARYTVSEHLQTEIFNAVNLLLWTKTRKAEKGRGKPKRIRLWEPERDEKAIEIKDLKETLSIKRK
ncbi:MAG: DUF5361 domain-containing protein [Clostridiales bacterium]|nr:DUF5361 domain-containing protein [Clostridiales bacterium]